MESTAPYRASVAQTLCSTCSDPTDLACLRCARPLCRAHQPAPDERCTSCENAYAERIAAEEPRQRRRLAKIGTLIVTAYLVVLFAAGFTLGEAAVWVLALAAAAATPLMWRRTVVAMDRERRGEFLAERPPSA